MVLDTLDDFWDDWYDDPILDGYDFDADEFEEAEASLQEDDDMDYTVKGESRDRKIAKRKHGMRVDGRSVFVIQQAQQKRDKSKGGR